MASIGDLPGQYPYEAGWHTGHRLRLGLKMSSDEFLGYTISNRLVRHERVCAILPWECPPERALLELLDRLCIYMERKLCAISAKAVPHLHGTTYALYVDT